MALIFGSLTSPCSWTSNIRRTHFWRYAAILLQSYVLCLARFSLIRSRPPKPRTVSLVAIHNVSRSLSPKMVTSEWQSFSISAEIESAARPWFIGLPRIVNDCVFVSASLTLFLGASGKGEGEPAIVWNVSFSFWIKIELIVKWASSESVSSEYKLERIESRIFSFFGDSQTSKRDCGTV